MLREELKSGGEREFDLAEADWKDLLSVEPLGVWAAIIECIFFLKRMKVMNCNFCLRLDWAI